MTMHVPVELYGITYSCRPTRADRAGCWWEIYPDPASDVLPELRKILAAQIPISFAEWLNERRR